MSKDRPSLTRLIVNPSCLVGPGVWLQKDKAAKKHRQLVKRAWPTRPRWTWCLLFTANVVCWYLATYWIQLYRCLKSPAYQALGLEGITRRQQLADLMFIGLWYGIRPADYYQFQLYRVARHQWLQYAFSQEQFTWHRVFSCFPGSVSEPLINDKLALEQRLRESGIATVKTIAVLDMDTAFDIEQVFCRRELFIKPRSANAMRGCLSLYYQPQQGAYRVSGYDLNRSFVELRDQRSITQFLTNMRQQRPLLVQDPLFNSPAMAKYVEMDGKVGHSTENGLVTIKVVSCLKQDMFKVVYILLEIPSGEMGSWWVYPVNPITGVPFFTHATKGQPSFNGMTELSTLPEFHLVVSMVERAHRLVSDIRTLCWDLCIAAQGPIIIEANTGWGLVDPQRISDTPLWSQNSQLSRMT